MIGILYGSLVGLSLGLMGGGGAILAVPLLIYGLHFDYPHATAVSSATVGITALFGAILQSHKGEVLWWVGAILGCGGIPCITFGRKIAAVLHPHVLLVMFALLMVFISIRMIFHLQTEKPASAMPSLSNGNTWQHLTLWKIVQLLFFGALVGILSGMFGIGGGFFLVPTLNFILGLPIVRATATSLVGIFLICVSGAFESRDFLFSADSVSSSLFLGGSTLGMIIGSYVKNLFPARELEICFGLFVFITAIFVLQQNFVHFY